MSIVKVEGFDNGSLDRANTLLAGIPDGVRKAVASAMPRAVDHLRKQTETRVRERYAITAANIRTEKNVKVSYSIGDTVTAFVVFSGRKIPLYRYNGSKPKEPQWNKDKLIKAKTAEGWKNLPEGMPAYGHVLAGTSPTLFKHAFTATMSNGHTGIFERNSSGIEEIMGLSVPQMIGNEAVTNALAQDASEKFSERLDHEVTRLLNGWGK